MILLLGLFAPRAAVVGYLVIALFFLLPVREIREARFARGGAPG